MTPREKLASLIEAELRSELDKEAILGAIAGGLGRLAGGAARARAALKGGVKAVGTGLKSRAAGIGQRFRAGFGQARHPGPSVSAVRGELSSMSLAREKGLQPGPVPVIRGRATRPIKRPGVTPAVERLRAVRAGATAPVSAPTPAPAAAPQKPRKASRRAAPGLGTPDAPAGAAKKTKKKGPGLGSALLAGSVLAPGGGQQQKTSHEHASVDLVDVIEKAGTMNEEQAVRLISESMELGFNHQIEKVAKGYGYSGKSKKKSAKKADEPEGSEKTASMGQKAKGILYSKYTVQDLVEHLAGEYGREEPIEKDASALKGSEKFARFLKEALSRPT